jgi:hypothetical protein
MNFADGTIEYQDIVKSLTYAEADRSEVAMRVEVRPPARAKNGARAQSAPRRTVVCQSHGTFRTSVNPSDISELLKQPDTFVWLDLQSPQDDDIALLREEFHFHPLSIEDATRHHERPKHESF